VSVTKDRAGRVTSTRFAVDSLIIAGVKYQHGKIGIADSRYDLLLFESPRPPHSHPQMQQRWEINDLKLQSSQVPQTSRLGCCMKKLS
jgi:hypothetical protein